MTFRLGALAALSLLAVGCADEGTIEYDGDAPGWRLPEGAEEIGPDTYFVGYDKDVDGTEIEGRVFVHRAGGHGDFRAKPPGTPGGGGGGGTSTCYALLASGAKWKAEIGEPWAFDPTGSPLGDVTQLLAGDIDEWESHAAADIFGEGSTDSGYEPNLNTVDNVNGAQFGPIADAGVIAVTYTWGVYSGSPKNRRLVEWDQIYDNDGDFAWDTDGDEASMDFDNIATHEIGHAMGLGHPSGCTEETMYAYADVGETKKRDLNAGDIAGINSMY